MKSKYDVQKLLDRLRAELYPDFKTWTTNDSGIHYNPKITKKEKYDKLIAIDVLKWVLSDYDYDQTDHDSILMKDTLSDQNDADLT